MQKLPYTTFYRINNIFHNHAIYYIFTFICVRGNGNNEIYRSCSVKFNNF